MELIIMRHGEADWHSLDHERELTESGRKAVAKVAEQIAQSSSRPSLIWCSPLVRAQQTAAIVADILGCPVEEKPFITPDDDPGHCFDALLENHESPLMLVSHMPLVGTLTTLLTEGHRRGMPFMTSQAVLLDMQVVGPGCASLKRQILPR
ncbi:phosphohistidine phosphatase SixA [Marinobacter sp.]|uniref:phosphohistidine phosphatase SixA n=1 Tax=Marinobacter sp. TaxID=50741 RepID=UPI00356979DF